MERVASAAAKAQYRHIGDIADRYRCWQTDSSIADADTSIVIVANPGPRLSPTTRLHRLDPANPADLLPGSARCRNAVIGDWPCAVALRRPRFFGPGRRAVVRLATVGVAATSPSTGRFASSTAVELAASDAVGAADGAGSNFTVHFCRALSSRAASWM